MICCEENFEEGHCDCELEKYKSIAAELAEALRKGMAALAHQADPIDAATVMGEVLAKYHHLTTLDSNKGK